MSMRTTYLAEDLRYDSKKIEPVIESLKAKQFPNIRYLIDFSSVYALNPTIL